ncbi:MAG: serine hydrolase domain-containing protein [Bacteroidota bacterium]
MGLFLTAPFTLAQAQLPIDWATLDSQADSLVRQHGSVGASVIVVNRDCTLFFGGYGHASLASNRGVTDSSLFVLGSITKTFTALGILRLVQEGKLTLADEVKTLAPELPISNQWEDEFPLRIYHLLEHTSGFDELHLKDKSIPVSDDEFPLIEGLDIVQHSLQTRWKPSTGFAYSNVGYLVAGYLIEKVSGKPYNDFMFEDVLAPLNMRHSSIRLNDIDQARLASSYSPSKQALPFKHIFTRPTGSLISSSNDMAYFLRMLLHKGDPLLNGATFHQFETHHSIEAFAHTENGYRLGVYPRFHQGRTWLGHGGSINKYNSEFEYCHALGLGIFVVSNGPNATKTVDGILSAFHRLIPEKSEPKPTPPDPPYKGITTIEGYYVLTTPRNQLSYPFTELFTAGISVKSDNGKVTASGVNGWTSSLIQTGVNRFSLREYPNQYQYVFDPSADLLYTSLGYRYRRIPFWFMATLACNLMVSLVVIGLSQVSLLIRVVRLIKGQAKGLSPQLTLEVGASTFLIGGLLYLLSGTIQAVHEPHVVTVGLFLCTIMLPILTLLGVIQAFKHRFRNVVIKAWTITLAASMTILSGYLIYWGWFGFAIWSY